jgi:hypothetical protein
MIGLPGPREHAEEVWKACGEVVIGKFHLDEPVDFSLPGDGLVSMTVLRLRSFLIGS